MLYVVAPLLGHALYQTVRLKAYRERLVPAAVGLAPLLLWLLWATLYFGFPFPNTAYAKLNLEIPRSVLLSQGLTYVVDKFKSWKHAGHITLMRGERSRLAEFASEEL